MSTFQLDTDSSHWIAYQFLCGFGLGLGMQTSGLVVQRVLPFSDVPIGIALMFFLQQLGGCIFTTVGQTILSNLLVSDLTGIPGIDPSMIVTEGATKLASVVSPGDMVVVQRAYNSACTRIFLASMGLSFGALLSSLGMEWNSIKKGKNGQDGAGRSDALGGKSESEDKRQRRPSKWSTRALKTRAEDNFSTPGCGKRV